MLLKRVENWDYYLHDIINQYYTMNTYQLGLSDCWLFLADCLQSMFKFDIAKDLRQYATLNDIYTMVKESKYVSILDVVDTFFDRVTVSEVKRGDLCINLAALTELSTKVKIISSPAVIVDSLSVSINEQGIITQPYLLCDTFWSVDSFKV